MEFEIFPTVASIAKKNVLLASPEITVRAATQMMYEHNVSSILLEKNNERYIFSVEDLLQYVHDGDNVNLVLSQLQMHKAVCIRDDEHVLAALESLEKSAGRYLAVVDAMNALVGIVTYTDILSAIDPAVLVEKKSIGELISHEAPVTFTPDWILEDVLFHLRKMEDSIVVVDDGIPVGIVTTRDVFGLISSGRGTSGPLHEYMSSPVKTTPVSASIHHALMQLKNCNIKRAVVVDDNGKLVGVVTQSELVGFAYGTWINLIKHHATELRELVAILEVKARGFEKESLTDALTGLANRRYFHRRIDDEMERMRRYQSTPFSVLLFDIDYFKKINDQHGHLIGDEVLKKVAQVLTETVRRPDNVFRWGGEEFVVLMPHSNLSAAAELATRIRTSIEQTEFPGGIKVTVSGGGGEMTLDEQPPQFLDRIDKALYQAKINGRNRVEMDTFPAVQEGLLIQ
jgi:diguanylate cyclase